jgi:CDP-diglyceride synthetase
LTEVAVAAAQALYLFSPLLFAALLSAVVLRFDLFSRLKKPIDAGHTFRGRRLFGDSKTWRGVFVAVVGCVAMVFVQKHVRLGRFDYLELVDYEGIHPLGFGTAMGATAMLGELPNSFVKRQLGIPPGGTTKGLLAAVFYTWDQLDLLTTAWPVVLFWAHPRPLVVLMSFVVALGLHPLVSLVGFSMRARVTIR